MSKKPLHIVFLIAGSEPLGSAGMQVQPVVDMQPVLLQVLLMRTPPM